MADSSGKASLMAAVIGIGVLVVYVTTSVFFLKYPTIIHRKKKQGFKCVHISHRGGAAENYENTITAFCHAVDLGTHMLELDVQLTRDGQVVVSHDNDLKRMTGQAGCISDFNYEELPEIRPPVQLDFDSELRVSFPSTDRKIPLLTDVFRNFPATPMNIDMKQNNDELIQKVADLVSQFGREKLTVWGNFNQEIISKAHRINRDVAMCFSIRRVAQVVILFWLGLLPFIPIQEEFFEVLLPSVFKRREFVARNWKLRAFMWIADKMMASKVLFGHLKRRGIQVYFWVLNSEDDWDEAFRLGANGVMTDYPTRLRQYLLERPHLLQNTVL